MHKSPKNFALASAAMALALAPATAGAQDQTMPGNAPQNALSSMPQTSRVTTQPTGPDSGSPTEDSYEQSAEPATSDPTTTETTGTDAAGTAEAASTRSRMIAPADQQAAILSWPAETQFYYKSLTTERQKLFWALTDSNKVRLSKMPQAQRDAVWTQIEAQLAPTKG